MPSPKKESLEKTVLILQKKFEALEKRFQALEAQILLLHEPKRSPHPSTPPPPVLPEKYQYQLKIQLRHAKPALWRKILVPDSLSLAQLHAILQMVMGWYNCHLHHFIVGQRFYGDPQEAEYSSYSSLHDESSICLKEIFNKKQQKILYEYDFGDQWIHEILLEKVHPFDPAQELPFCLKGKGHCPPEDCGGVWGYFRLREILKNPQHPEYEESLRWVGDAFQPDEFDRDFVNSLLKRWQQEQG
jgi:hypothetical protein